jgi:segregation and condensation protein B
MDQEPLTSLSLDEGGRDEAAFDTSLAAVPADETPPTSHVATDRLEALVESLLFAAGAPVPIARLVEALGGPGRAEVLEALEALAVRYESEERGIRLAQVAGGWQLRTPPEHGPYVRRLLRERPPRLSRPMLETLAIVAYRQPCTRVEIEAVRGVDADAVLATLTDRRLVRILGRKDAPGRPLLYGTTREFLEVFGLPDLKALPALRDLGEAAALLAPDLTVDGNGVHETSSPADGPAATAAPQPADE